MSRVCLEAGRLPPMKAGLDASAPTLFQVTAGLPPWGRQGSCTLLPTSTVMSLGTLVNTGVTARQGQGCQAQNPGGEGLRQRPHPRLGQAQGTEHPRCGRAATLFPAKKKPDMTLGLPAPPLSGSPGQWLTCPCGSCLMRGQVQGLNPRSW